MQYKIIFPALMLSLGSSVAAARPASKFYS